jgi:hypothetical protein
MKRPEEDSQPDYVAAGSQSPAPRVPNRTSPERVTVESLPSIWDLQFEQRYIIDTLLCAALGP